MHILLQLIYGKWLTKVSNLLIKARYKISLPNDSNSIQLEYNMTAVQVSRVIIVLLESMYPLQDVPWNGKAFHSFGVCSRNGLAGLKNHNVTIEGFSTECRK